MHRGWILALLATVSLTALVATACNDSGPLDPVEGPVGPIVDLPNPGCVCSRLNVAACRPTFLGDYLVDDAPWEIVGFSQDRLDEDRVGRMQRGESLELSFDDNDDRPLTNLVDEIRWLSTNPGVVTVTPEGPLTARLEAVGAGRVVGDPTHYVQAPVVATVYFSDSSCGNYAMQACERYTGVSGRLLLRCTRLTALVVE